MRGRRLGRIGLAVAIFAAALGTRSDAQFSPLERGTLRPSTETSPQSMRSPTGPPPWKPTGPPPWNPTGRTPLGTSRPHPVTGAGGAEAYVHERAPIRQGGGTVAVVEERGVDVPVSASFYCQGHNRGFGGRDSFESHVEAMHGHALDDVSGALVVDGGVWILPSG